MNKEKQLLALVSEAEDLKIPRDLCAFQVGDWQATFAQYRDKQALRFLKSRNRVLHQAKQRQLWLEGFSGQGTVIPALPETFLNPDDLGLFFAANETKIRDMQDLLRGKVQFQVLVRCDITSAWQFFSKQANLFREARCEKSWVGAFRNFIIDALSEIPGVQYQSLPIYGDFVFNCVVLLPTEMQQELDAILCSIDALWSEGLEIKQVGPSPGISFASFGVTKVSIKQLRASARLLGVSLCATSKDVKDARRFAIIKGEKDPQKVNYASELLLSAGRLKKPTEFPKLFVWSEGASLPREMRREGAVA